MLGKLLEYVVVSVVISVFYVVMFSAANSVYC